MTTNQKDYYQILNIHKAAGTKEIKQAFRKLALKFHPDLNKNQEAEETFKAVNEAYEVLSDIEKRLQYDRIGHTNFFEKYCREDMFGGMPEWGCKRRKMSGRFNPHHFFTLKKEHQQNNDYIFNLTLTFEEAVRGIEKDIFLTYGHHVKHFRVIIPPGTNDGDLVQIKARKSGDYDEQQCYLRVNIIK